MAERSWFHRTETTVEVRGFNLTALPTASGSPPKKRRRLSGLGEGVTENLSEDRASASDEVVSLVSAPYCLGDNIKGLMEITEKLKRIQPQQQQQQAHPNAPLSSTLAHGNPPGRSR